MLRPLCLFLLAVGSAGAFAQADDERVRAALAAERAFDSVRALALFRDFAREHPSDAYVQQKISRQLSDLTLDTTDLAEKRRLAAEALVHAEEATRLDPKNPVNLVSVAICHGKIATYADTRERIERSRLVKEFAERALAQDPQYDWAHHVLGRWHYEAASLGRTSRIVVKLVYGGLPPASYEQAILHLERAVALAPQTLAHRLELGIALLGAGRTNEGRARLEEGLKLESREKHDNDAKRRARAALERLRK
jgi:tetratricopeptide (TPR) repeat protein